MSHDCPETRRRSRNNVMGVDRVVMGVDINRGKKSKSLVTVSASIGLSRMHAWLIQPLDRRENDNYLHCIVYALSTH